MSRNFELHRRGLLKLVAGVAMATEIMCAEHVRGQSAPTDAREVGVLHSRDEFVIRGGHGLTMDPAIADLSHR